MQLVATLAVAVSVLVLAYQGRELAKHTRVANEVAGVETHRKLMRHWKSITDVFIEHPELRAQSRSPWAGLLLARRRQAAVASSQSRP